MILNIELEDKNMPRQNVKNLLSGKDKLGGRRNIETYPIDESLTVT